MTPSRIIFCTQKIPVKINYICIIWFCLLLDYWHFCWQGMLGGRSVRATQAEDDGLLLLTKVWFLRCMLRSASHPNLLTSETAACPCYCWAETKHWLKVIPFKVTHLCTLAEGIFDKKLLTLKKQLTLILKDQRKSDSSSYDPWTTLLIFHEDINMIQSTEMASPVRWTWICGRTFPDLPVEPLGWRRTCSRLWRTVGVHSAQRERITWGRQWTIKQHYASVFALRAHVMYDSPVCGASFHSHLHVSKTHQNNSNAHSRITIYIDRRFCSKRFSAFRLCRLSVCIARKKVQYFFIVWQHPTVLR